MSVPFVNLSSKWWIDFFVQFVHLEDIGGDVFIDFGISIYTFPTDL